MPDPKNTPKFEDTQALNTGAPSFDETEPILEGSKKKEPTTLPSPSNSGTVKQGSAPSVSTGGTSGLAPSGQELFDKQFSVEKSTAKQVVAPQKKVAPTTPFGQNLPETNLRAPSAQEQEQIDIAQEQKKIEAMPEGAFTSKLVWKPIKNIEGKIVNVPVTEQYQKKKKLDGTYDLVPTAEITPLEKGEKFSDDVKEVTSIYDALYTGENGKEIDFNKDLTGALNNDKDKTLDFYNKYLEVKNPSEYTYVTTKLAELNRELSDDATTPEEKKKAQADIEKYQSDLYVKALKLKNQVYQYKSSQANKNLKTFYKTEINTLKGMDSDFKSKTAELDNIKTELAKFPVDENGNIAVSGANQKVVSDLIEKYNQTISDVQKLQEDRNNIMSDEGFKNTLEASDEAFKKLEAVSNEGADYLKTIEQKFPEFYKEIAKVKSEQDWTDLVQKLSEKQIDEMGGPEFIKGLGAIGPTLGRTVTNLVTKLSYIPKAISVNDEYGWTDELYDHTKESIDSFNQSFLPQPSDYDKPIYSEKDGFNSKYVLSKTLGTLAEMAEIALISRGLGASVGALGASGEVSSAISNVTSGYIFTASDYYNEAKQLGMDEKDAVSFSNYSAMVQGVLELVSPNEKLLKSADIKRGMKEYTKMLSEGVSKKEALKGFSRELFKDIGAESLQEYGQMLAEISSKRMANNILGKNVFEDDNVKEQTIETLILTALSTAAFKTIGLKGLKERQASLYKESLYQAATNPEKFIQSIQDRIDAKEIGENEAKDLIDKINLASEAYSKIDANKSNFEKMEVLPYLMEKIKLEKKKSQVDDTMKEGVQQEIETVNEAIKETLDIKEETKKEGEAVVTKEPETVAIEDEINYLKSIDQEIGLDENEKSRLEELQTKINKTNEEAKNKDQTKVLTSEEDNKMQQEGLVEVDSTEKTNPIELPIEEEKKTSPIQEPLKKQEDVNQENKIGIQGSEQIGQEPIKSESKQTASSKKTSTGGVLQTQKEEVTPETETEVKKPPITKKEELLDEEDLANQEQVAEDKNIVQKLSDDVTVMKTLTDKGKLDLKFKGSLERAYKAWKDKKISYSSYTEHKKKISQVSAGKFNVEKEEVLMNIDRLKQEVKTKLLGEGYKNIALSTGSPITPKTVEQLIDVTFGLAKRAAATSIDTKEAIEKALKLVKGNPSYKKFVSAGSLSPEEFEKQIREKAVEFFKEEEIKKPSPKKEGAVSPEGEQKKKKKTIERLEKDPKYKKLVDEIGENEALYTVTNKKQVADFVKEKIDEYEKADMLLDLGLKLLEDKENIFPEVMKGVGYALTGKKIEERSEMSDLNEMEKSDLINLSSKLMLKSADYVNTAGKISAMQDIVNKEFGQLSGSEAWTTAVISNKIKGIQEEVVSKEDKASFSNFAKDANEMLNDTEFNNFVSKIVSEKIDEIASSKIGEKEVKKRRADFSSLKTNLKDC
jgi:hypothetical protein